MIAVVTVLLAFPLGYRLRSHFAANTAYAIAYLWAFVYQTLYLVLDAMNDTNGAAFDAPGVPAELWARHRCHLRRRLRARGMGAPGR